MRLTPRRLTILGLLLLACLLLFAVGRSLRDGRHGGSSGNPAAQARHEPGGAFGDALLGCDFDHAGPDDPIVHPGGPGDSHEHVFFGSRGINAFSTFSSMLAGPTTCQLPLDTAGYWMPAIIKNGVGVNPTRMTVYYRRNTAERVLPFPLGLKHVQGNASNTSSNTYAMTYGCGNNAGQTTIPVSCAAGQGILVSIYFSGCWNGTDIDNATHKTLGTCGSAFPVKVPSIQMQFMFPAGAVGGRLSSDLPGAPAGTSGHADFWNTWDPFELDKVVRLCLNADKHCRVQDGVVNDVGVSPPAFVFTPGT